ncbi:hypothetical protein KSZ_31990 [Dictyobacter formicarum]|uniref:Hydrogenase nickel incorporation protein HypA n=1 Tax=Dictyobacter formicarum TaxID=2778368 RepID=A0ABQ3VHT7_9CHLR|nr:hypothetical protein KSZ_31990 [Dictyobacter formicarum]
MLEILLYLLLFLVIVSIVLGRYRVYTGYRPLYTEPCYDHIPRSPIYDCPKHPGQRWSRPHVGFSIPECPVCGETLALDEKKQTF